MIPIGCSPNIALIRCTISYPRGNPRVMIKDGLKIIVPEELEKELKAKSGEL